VDTLLAEESTCLGRWLGWCTPGRPSSDLLDLAERSLDADVKAETDLADHLAKALPATGAHTVTVERQWPGIVPTGVLEGLVEQSSMHSVVILSCSGSAMASLG